MKPRGSMEVRDARETVVCNLCQATSYRIVYDARDISEAEVNLAERFRSSSDETLVEQLVECTHCGLQYVNPRLKADLVLEGYSHGSDEVFVSQARSREHTFAKSLDAIERQTNGRRGRILDVGTAGGSFLRAASRRGWEVEGCEPNRWLCDWAQRHYGITVRPGTIFEQAYAAGEFDVVSLWDVLEHTPDPKSLILECRRLLKPNGLLVVNYPDIGSWIARLMGRSWVFLLDVHLYYFTRATLGRLLAEAGFTVSLTRPHYQWLELGYVLRRARPYVGTPALLAERASSGLGLDKWRIPYWVGQTLVIARRSATKPSKVISVLVQSVGAHLVIFKYTTEVLGVGLECL